MNSVLGDTIRVKSRAVLEPGRRQTWIWLPGLVVILGAGIYSGSADDTQSSIRICVANYHQGYFDQEFEDGPVTIPAGAVFAFNGYVIPGVPQGERRCQGEVIDKIIREQTAEHIGRSAIATTASVTVTKSSPCVSASAIIVLSKKKNWAEALIPADGARYYNLIGSIREGALTENVWGENDQRGHAEYYAEICGIITKTIVLNTGAVE